MKEKEKKKNQFKKKYLYGLLIIISFLPFLNLLNAEFVNWDDDIYVTQNSKVLQGLTFENVKWAFSTTYFGFYYPLTWISHMTDVSLYGLNSRGHHLSNILIHILNSLLLLSFLLKTKIDEIKSFIISALFAVHPLNVESVGWISERKNLLAAFFFFLALNLYLRYIETKKNTFFIALFVAYLCGLMSKSVLVTFPIVLYLIDVWPLKRIYLDFSFIRSNLFRLLKEKIAFFIPVPVFAYLTIIAQKEVSALSTFDVFPLDQRIAGAILAYGRYLYQFLLPFKLTAFYPHLRNNYSFILLIFTALALCGLLLLFLKLAKKDSLYLIGYIWFFVNLLPVIGIIQVGEQGSADRYMYIPMIGLLWLLVFGVFDLFAKLKFNNKNYILSFFLIIFVLFSIKTHYQCKIWKNSDALFENMIKESPNPAQGYINAGLQYKIKKDYLKAVELYKKAIEADPLKANAYNNLGSALYELKDIEEANKAFKKAVELNPNHSVMVYNLALSEEILGNTEKAKQLYLRAIQIRKSAPAPRKKLIKIYEKENNYEEALKLSLEGEKLVDYDPEFSVETVQILVFLKKYEEAKKMALERLNKFPNNSALMFLYAYASFLLGQMDEAELYCEKSLNADNQNIDSVILLSEIKIRQHKIKDAFETLREGLHFNPNDPRILAKIAELSKNYSE